MAIFEFTLDDFLARKKAGTLPPLKKVEDLSRFGDELKKLACSDEQLLAEQQKLRAKKPGANMMVKYFDGEPLTIDPPAVNAAVAQAQRRFGQRRG